MSVSVQTTYARGARRTGAQGVVVHWVTQWVFCREVSASAASCINRGGGEEDSRKGSTTLCPECPDKFQRPSCCSRILAAEFQCHHECNDCRAVVSNRAPWHTGVHVRYALCRATAACIDSVACERRKEDKEIDLHLARSIECEDYMCRLRRILVEQGVFTDLGHERFSGWTRGRTD